MYMQQKERPEKGSSNPFTSTAAAIDTSLTAAPWDPPDAPVASSCEDFEPPPGAAAIPALDALGHWGDDSDTFDPASSAVSTATRSHGAPLPQDLQRQFQSSLGHDLSGVRLHTGAESATAAKSLRARAYTTGTDIHFAAGQYDPTSPAGKRLLAHEVAHTVQQGAGGGVPQCKLEVSTTGDAHEVEADQAADAMVAGRPAEVSADASARSMIQREGDEEPAESAPDEAALYAEMKLRLRAWKQQNPNQPASEYPYQPGEPHLTQQDEAAIDAELAQCQEAQPEQVSSPSSEAPEQNYTSAEPEQNYTPAEPEQNYTPAEPEQNYTPAEPEQNYTSAEPEQNYTPAEPEQTVTPVAPEQDSNPMDSTPGQVPPSLVASPEEMHGGCEGSSGGVGADPSPKEEEPTPYVDPADMRGGAEGAPSSSPSELPRGTYDIGIPDVGPAVVPPDPVCAQSYAVSINPDAIPVTSTPVPTPAGVFTFALKTTLSAGITLPNANPNVALSNKGWEVAAQKAVGEYMQKVSVKNLGNPDQLSIEMSRTGQYASDSVSFSATPPTMSYQYSPKPISFTTSDGAIISGSLGFELAVSFEPYSAQKVPFTQELFMIALGTAAIATGVYIAVAAPTAGAIILRSAPALVEAAPGLVPAL